MTNIDDDFSEQEDPIFGKLIYSYSRAQAIEDGVLADVTDVAKQVGFRYPVAITSALHDRLQPSQHDLGQDYDGRLWDVLWMAALKVRLGNSETDTIRFSVIQQEADSKTGQLHNIDLHLWAVCGPGDEGEPVVTIGFPQDF
jgi:hypothetical protein